MEANNPNNADNVNLYSFALYIRDGAPLIINITDVNRIRSSPNRSNQIEANVPTFLIPNEEHSNPKQIPTRLLRLENVEELSNESLENLFDGCGHIRKCLRYCDTALVFFQTQAMAQKFMIKFCEKFENHREEYKIRYGQIRRTKRIWIGGLSPNITEKDIKDALQEGHGIKNITWFRKPEEVEVYILYHTKPQAKEAVNRIRQVDFALRTSNASLQVDYADLCCFPLEYRNCQTITEIGDNCMTQIPTVFSSNLFAIQNSAKLHYIAGDCSIAQDMIELEEFPLQISTLININHVNIENDIRTVGCSNTVFLGIFEEQSEDIVLFLRERDNIGLCFNETNREEILVSYVFPSGNLHANGIMQKYFEDFVVDDARNQTFVVVIVQKLLPV